MAYPTDAPMRFECDRKDVPLGRFSASTLLEGPQRVRHGAGSRPERRRQAGPTGRLDAGPGRARLAAHEGLPRLDTAGVSELHLEPITRILTNSS